MAIVITGNGIDMGGNPVSNASQIDSTVINENGSNVRTESDSYSKTETDGKIIGVDQTWQDVTASRAYGVTYTNTTGKPIMVQFESHSTTSSMYSTAYVDGLGIREDVSSATTTKTNNFSFIVPAGSTYKISCNLAGSPTIWAELR